MIEGKDTFSVDDLYGVEEFAGKYHVGEQLGTGSYGCVYRATDPRLNRSVALKVLKPRPGRESEEDVYGEVVRERFKREARLVAGLKEPSTVTVHEWDEWQGMLYAAYEYIEGKSLGECLNEGRKFSPREWIKILEQILDSLAEAHAKGIVHRDIKPANIMLSEHERRGFEVKVLDFGIGKMLRGYADAEEANERDFNTLTRADEAVGTTRYMSPEQLRGEKLTPACDVWALGVVCAEALTGEQGFSGEPYTIVSKILERGTREIEGVLKTADIPDFLREMVEKMTQSELEKRYKSAGEILDDQAFELLKSQPKKWESSGLVEVEEESEAQAAAPEGDAPTAKERLPAGLSPTEKSQADKDDAPTVKARPKSLGKDDSDLPVELRGESDGEVWSGEKKGGEGGWGKYIVAAVVLVLVAMSGWFLLPDDAPNVEPPSEKVLEGSQTEKVESLEARLEQASEKSEELGEPREDILPAQEASGTALEGALEQARESAEKSVVQRTAGKRKAKALPSRDRARVESEDTSPDRASAAAIEEQEQSKNGIEDESERAAGAENINEDEASEGESTPERKPLIWGVE